MVVGNRPPTTTTETKVSSGRRGSQVGILQGQEYSTFEITSQTRIGTLAFLEPWCWWEDVNGGPLGPNLEGPGRLCFDDLFPPHAGGG